MSVRRAALAALADITDNGAYANLRLKSARSGLSSRDGAWLTALVYTTLDNLLYIDYILAHFVKGRQNAKVRGVLRMGVCQLLFMDTPESAACSESVKLVREIGKGDMAGFVNGVMRNIARHKDDLPPLPEDARERLSIEFSRPRYMVDEYVRLYGEDFTRDMFMYQGHELTIRAQYPYTEDELKEWLDNEGVSYARGKLDTNAFRLETGIELTAAEPFISGKITVQSESAMLVCRALMLKGGERVLDACAAPGGKTAYLASLTKNDLDITAWDIHPHRAELINNTLSRLGVSCAHTDARDAAVFLPELAGRFDAVLVDAPCSGLGVYGKPDARYKKSDGSIEELAALQHGILDTASRYVRPGGALVYATCTISERENELRLRRFLNEHGEYIPGDMSGILPSALSDRTRDGGLQLFPHIDGSEGFYLARLVRSGK